MKPHGGLGNRIRVLYSVLGINRKLNHEIRIFWDHHQELNCPFEELFLIPDSCKVFNIKQNLFRKIYRFSLDRLYLSNLRKYKYDLVLYDKEISKFRKENLDFYSLLKNHSNIYLETCRHFYKGPKITDFLTINPSILNQAEKIYNKFPESTYGLHIRSTDNVVSKKYSPPSAFKKLIRKKLQEESGVTFFLTTDSKKIKNEFRNEFKENLITNNMSTLSRNSSEGIKNALIEMVCLSKTKKVFGSYYSSFSSISANLSGTEYENVIAENANPKH